MLDFEHTKTTQESSKTVKKTAIKFNYKTHLIIVLSVAGTVGTHQVLQSGSPSVDLNHHISGVNDVILEMADRYLTRRYNQPIELHAKRHLVIRETAHPKLPDEDSAEWKEGGIGHAIGYKDTEEGRFYMVLFSYSRLDKRKPSWVYLEVET